MHAATGGETAQRIANSWGGPRARLSLPGMADIETLSGWIALVLGEAPRLRAAGVLSIGAEGCTVTLAPLAAIQPAGEIEKPDATVAAEGLDPLHDPHSYPGGIVPGYDLEGARRERARSVPLDLGE